MHVEDSIYHRECDFVGIVRAPAEEGLWEVEGRNRFFAGEELELIGPEMRQATFSPAGLQTAEGRPVEVVQPNARVSMRLPQGSRPGDILRRWK